MALAKYIIVALLIHFMALQSELLVSGQNCGSRSVSPYTRKRFKPSQIDKICSRKQKWNDDAEKSTGVQLDSILTPRQMDYFNSVEECDLLCLCKRIALCKEFIDSIERVIGKGTTDKLAELIKGGTENGGEIDISKLGLGSIGKLIGGGKGLFGGRKKRQINFREKLPPVVRKEYRRMTDEERERFHRTLNKLKRSKIDNLSKFDILVVYHTPENAPGAHFGPALLPFHRELIKRLEVAMRLEDPQVSLPYWDSTLDEILPAPADSVLWTSDFLGSGQGVVTTGPFAGWIAFDHPRAREMSPDLRLVRNVGQNQFGSLYTMGDIQHIKDTARTYRDLTFCIEPLFELVHGAVHMYVGGFMDPLESSPNDPVFFMLHAFVDALWEEFRQTRQTPQQRESEYVEDGAACNQYHYGNAQMRPFKINNIGGLSNDYTSQFYQYEARPSCNQNDPDCGSPYLFCHTGLWRCASKVRIGGNCRGLEPFDSCAGGTCTNGRCVANQATPRQTEPPPTTTTTVPPTTTSTTTTTTTTTTPTTTTTTTTTTRATPRIHEEKTTPKPRPVVVTVNPTIPTSKDTVWFPITVQQYHNRLVKQVTNATIRTVVEGTGETYEGEIAKTNKYPYFVGAAFAQIPNPQRQATPLTAKLTVIGATGFPCTAMCYQEDKGYLQCDIKMTISRDPKRSTPLAYTPYKEQAPYLSWNGPERRPDNYYFLCPLGGTLPSINELRESKVLGFLTQTTQAPAISKSGCVNLHRCCKLWQSVGECNRNRNYMLAACPVACNVNNKCSSAGRKDCTDRFERCPVWKQKGECKRNPIWMEENCDHSCGVCARTTAQLKTLCGAPSKPGCDNFNRRCQAWSKRGECKQNSWWMGENCPLACKKCNKTTKS